MLEVDTKNVRRLHESQSPDPKNQDLIHHMSPARPQDTDVFIRYRVKHQNTEIIGKSESKQRKHTIELNTSWCRRSQNKSIPRVQDINIWFFCFPVHLTKISSMEFSDASLNEFYFCEFTLLYDSKKIEIKNHTAFFFDDRSRSEFKLSVIVCIQVIRRLSPMAANVSEDNTRTAKAGCTTSTSGMSLLMANSMNGNKTCDSECRNLKFVISGKEIPKDIKQNCLYRGESRTNEYKTDEMCSEDTIFLKITDGRADIFCGEVSSFHRQRGNCLKLHENNYNGADGASSDQDTRYLFIKIYLINMDARSKSVHNKLYTKCNNVPATSDVGNVPADPHIADRHKYVERSSYCLSAGVIFSIYILSYRRSTFTNSIKETNFLEMFLCSRDVIYLKLRIRCCNFPDSHQTRSSCCVQTDKEPLQDVQLSNKHKRLNYLISHPGEELFSHIRNKICRKTLFNHSDRSMWTEKQLKKCHHKRGSVKQYASENISALTGILNTETTLDTAINNYDFNVSNHYIPFNRQEDYWKYSPLSHLLSGRYLRQFRNRFRVCSKFGGRRQNFLKRQPNYHEIFSSPMCEFKSIINTKDFTTSTAHLELAESVCTKTGRAQTTTAMAAEPRIMDNYKTVNFWVRILRKMIIAIWQKERSRPQGKDAVENKQSVNKSGYIKGRQAMLSNNGTDFNQNSSRPRPSKMKGANKSQIGSSATFTDDDENDSDGTSDDDDDEITTKGNRIKSNIECMDNFLIIWHSGFLIMFLFLLGVGIVLRVYFSTIIERSVKSSANYVLYSHFVKIENVPDKLEFGNLTDVLGESLIILSSLYIGCVLCYMTFLIHRITFTIPLVVIVTGAVVLTEVNIINIYMSPVSAANEEAKKQLKERADKEYAVDSNKPFSVTYDLISIWVPPTCCEPSYFEKGVEDVVDCASTAEGIFNMGCYQTIYLWLRLYCNLYSIVVILQLLDLCIHIILYKKHLSLLTLEDTHMQQLQQQATIE